MVDTVKENEPASGRLNASKTWSIQGFRSLIPPCTHLSGTFGDLLKTTFYLFVSWQCTTVVNMWKGGFLLRFLAFSTNTVLDIHCRSLTRWLSHVVFGFWNHLYGVAWAGTTAQPTCLPNIPTFLAVKKSRTIHWHSSDSRQCPFSSNSSSPQMLSLRPLLCSLFLCRDACEQLNG